MNLYRMTKKNRTVTDLKARKLIAYIDSAERVVIIKVTADSHDYKLELTRSEVEELYRFRLSLK